MEEKKVTHKLNIEEGPEEGTSILLTGETHIIGRGEESDLVLADTAISKKHCRFEKTEDRYYLVDLGSTNGTFLNGIRLLPDRRYELEQGSLIRLGHSVLRYVRARGVTGRMEVAREDTLKISRSEVMQRLGEMGVSFEAEIIPYFMSSSSLLSKIYEILGAIGRASGKEDLLHKSVEAIFSSIPCDNAYLFLTENLEEAEMRPAAARSRKGEGTFYRENLNETIISKVLSSGNSIIGSGVSTEVGPPEANHPSEAVTKWVMCSPIKTKNRTWGIIYLDTTLKNEAFRKDGVELLTAVGIHLGHMIENLDR